jgi:hypothetical protein
MKNRQEILKDIVLMKGDLVDLQNRLSEFPWDSDEALVTISKQNLLKILTKAQNEKISFEHLVKWANTIECRDDLDFETDNLREIIFDLANPEINGEITEEKLDQIVSELE